jgi:hypothetical protein
LINLTLQNDTDQLVPLRNPQTNAQIANFPANSAMLNLLTCKLSTSLEIRASNILFLGPQKRALGTIFGINDPGAHIDAAAKKAYFMQLRIEIGLKPSPA